MNLAEITSFLGGKLRGGGRDAGDADDARREITGVAGIAEATEGYITLYKGNTPLNALLACSATAVLVKEELPEVDKAQVIVDRPSLAFARLLTLFYVKPFTPRGIMNGAYVADSVRISANNVTVYPGAYIADGATIGDCTTLYPGVYIGDNAEIGYHCILYPNVTIGKDCRIGDRVIIQPGAVVGSDGFGYELDGGKHIKVPQVGRVVVEDDVEIGANTTIDRATSGVTLIGAGTKIDNMVQIAHNVTIGKHSLIIAQTGIAGSSRLGDYVVLAGQVGVADHTTIESGTQLGAQAGAMGKINKGAYMGSPAMPHMQFKRSYALFKRLPEIHERLQQLEKQTIVDKKRED
ncbi:MAG: UDP-3-O-(3-hydroxymyristoyl)glucosamine N-acyltransferase [Nitrospirae bacterium]|uniref:UDP-3-O-(3-hydroxymyristoyl)glucosamine N-acyltransferase n=1 Tax=Candidatus Magnetobacterium casense TaxID=1455061 RepID=UPI00058AD6C6|nr:UDP-3-O-(3-hydroxymyristoyl)glucosamine N-acyltransferase [Candidatus Magnetobacterium casensis]MBF0339041.1 UDP-3-O-(3-hydroxymyristoyl)glucosamine N-acyltransferase [Nitrospirota bacterium]